jgi:hypothetical protein
MALRLGLGRGSTIALLVAGVWSLGVLVAGFTVPVYTEVTETPGSKAFTRSSETLIAVNGSGAVLVLLIPLLITAIVTPALVAHAHPAGMAVAWSVSGLFAAFNLLAMLTIGIALVPITLALLVACALATGDTSRRSGREFSAA